MPTRIVREGILTSEPVNKLSDRAENFYRRLMSVADDYGRFYSHPSLLRAACYPLKLDVISEADVKQMLSECIAVDLIVCYGGKYLQVLKFGQQTRSKSKFPQPTDNELLIKCKSNDKQMFSLVGVGVGVGVEGVGEVESADECVAKTMTAGIPENFTRYVYDDWAGRSGKDASGVSVSFLPYVTKRWTREQVEWRNGKHKGVKQPANKRLGYIPDAK